MKKQCANVRILSSTTIRPASRIVDDEHRQIHLTPSDLHLLEIEPIQKGILFHKSNTWNISLIDHLKATLALTLDTFYPLAGRLLVTHYPDGKKSFSIDCTPAGALFVHAAMPANVSNILDPVYVPDEAVYSFFPMNGVCNHLGVSHPLLAVQLTELDNGVFLACTMNHSAADGTVFWRFLNAWSQLSRAGSIPNGTTRDPRHEISCDRSYLHGIVDLPVRIPFDPSRRQPLPPPQLRQRVFRFSKPAVARLKARANAAMGTATKEEEISSLQALLAHLWVTITRCRNIEDGDAEVSYDLSIGLRQRLVPALPEGYFGNAILEEMLRSTAGEVVGKGLGPTAWVIKQAVTAQTAERARKVLAEWTERPVMADELRPGHRLLTGSSPRFDVYGNDFGWGRPVGVRSGPANKFDGKLTVFPGAEEGSIEFEVCLRAETLEAMASDAEFMESLSIG